jgi:hypothetical protein
MYALQRVRAMTRRSGVLRICHWYTAPCRVPGRRALLPRARRRAPLAPAQNTLEGGVRGDAPERQPN